MRPGTLGTITVSGFPGHYTARLGLTGAILAEGDAASVLAAIAKEMRNEDGSKVKA